MKKNIFALIRFIVINIIMYAILIFIGFIEIKEIKIYIMAFILGSIGYTISLFFNKNKVQK